MTFFIGYILLGIAFSIGVFFWRKSPPLFVINEIFFSQLDDFNSVNPMAVGGEITVRVFFGLIFFAFWPVVGLLLAVSCVMSLVAFLLGKVIIHYRDKSRKPKDSDLQKINELFKAIIDSHGENND